MFNGMYVTFTCFYSSTGWLIRFPDRILQLHELRGISRSFYGPRRGCLSFALWARCGFSSVRVFCAVYLAGRTCTIHELRVKDSLVFLSFASGFLVLDQ